MSAPSHMASGTNADQLDTTPFCLPTAARKSVFHTLYLTEQCASVIRAPQSKSGEKPALVPSVEDAVEDARENHVPDTRLLDSDQHVINDESSDDNSTVNGDELADRTDGDDLLDGIGPDDSKTLGFHTSLSSTTSNTPAGYRSDSNDGSPVRYRSGSAGRCTRNRTEASGDPLIVLDDDGWEDTRTKASTPAPRGRDMRRLADLYNRQLSPYMSQITTSSAFRHSVCEPWLLRDDINNDKEAASLVWSPGTSRVPITFPTVEYNKPELQENNLGQGFGDLGIGIEDTPREALKQGSCICYKSTEKEEERSGIHASNLPYAPQKYYNHPIDQEVLARDYTAPMGMSDFWRISGNPVGPNEPRTYLTNARPFPEAYPADNISSRKDVSIDSSIPRSSISTLPDIKKAIPAANETVEFKMRILRSYKEWGLPMREQANQYTNRLIEEAERARKNGVIIPGLEESLKPIAFCRSQFSNLGNPAFNLKRLDVYLYHAPNNLRLADISFALQNTGSLQFIRYSKSKGEIHIRFVHEWSARRFAIGKTNVQLPLPDGKIHNMEIMLVPPTTYPPEVLDIPEPLSRKLRLGPTDMDLLGEMASEVVPAVQVNLADPHALVEAVVNAFCERRKVIHSTQFQTTSDSKAVFWIEFANINDAVMFKDAVVETGVISPYELVYEPDPCQGPLELTMLIKRRQSPHLRPKHSFCEDTESVPTAGKETRASHWEPSTTNMATAKGADGVTDYERHMKRKYELMMLQLTAQDELKETYKKLGAPALGGVIGMSGARAALPVARNRNGF